MLASNGNIAGKLAKCAQKASDYVTQQYGNYADENAVTDEFLGVFGYQVLNKNWPSDVSVNAKRVRDRGPNAVETRTGADFAIRYEFSCPDYVFRSGILSQAKYYDTYDDELDDLRKDCGKMIAHTSAAYLTTYSSDSFCYFPANAIYGLQEDAYDEVKNAEIYNKFHFRQTKAFYNRFFRGMIGDPSVYKNWNYYMDKRDERTRRPALPDGGDDEIPPDNQRPPEYIETMEGGAGLTISVTVE